MKYAKALFVLLLAVLAALVFAGFAVGGYGLAVSHASGVVMLPLIFMCAICAVGALGVGGVLAWEELH